MIVSNPNQLEKMGRISGFRNHEDIWEMKTFNDIKQEIELVSPNTKELIEESEFSSDMEKCLFKTRAFCNELSGEFKKEFVSLLDQYRKERRQISQKIVDYLLEKEFNLPSFIITHGKQAEVLLEDFGLDFKIDDKKLLLVLKLPKPLSQFWWKGGGDSWGDMSKDVQGSVIEWGHFYRELMPIIWETQGHYENENGLTFSRVNDVGEHDPQKYYYVWEMSKWKD